MINLINLPVETSEQLNRALQILENNLIPLKPYLTRSNTRRKDIIKQRKAQWLVQLKKYLKQKSYENRRWEQHVVITHNKIREDSSKEQVTTAVKLKELKIIEYERSLYQIA